MKLIGCALSLSTILIFSGATGAVAEDVNALLARCTSSNTNATAIYACLKQLLSSYPPGPGTLIDQMGSTVDGVNRELDQAGGNDVGSDAGGSDSGGDDSQ